MNDDVKEFKKQHRETYRNAIIDIISNNTDVLVYEDIASIIKKPPLDSMDLINCKFLNLAKKNKIVLKTNELSKILESYRKNLLFVCDEIKDYRYKFLTKKVNSFVFESDDDLIKINKKDFMNINKEIKKILKDKISLCVNGDILDNLNKIFFDDVSSDVREKFVVDISKFLKGNYQKQVIEGVEIKIMVKDTTLINSAKEQNDRYIYTLQNSRLLNDFSD